MPDSPYCSICYSVHKSRSLLLGGVQGSLRALYKSITRLRLEKYKHSL